MSAEIGVVLLMFTAGLETDLKELKSHLASSLIVAVLGILLPLLFGSWHTISISEKDWTIMKLF